MTVSECAHTYISSDFICTIVRQVKLQGHSSENWPKIWRTKN